MSGGPVEIRRIEPVMGTVVSLLARVDAVREEAVRDGVRRAVARLHEADDRFTTYRESEWLRYCRGALALDDAHPDLRHVVRRVGALERETGGAFSLTADLSRPPDPAAYVKGWAVQRAATEIRRSGADAVFLNGGGDVVVLGGERPWRIGIQDPSCRDRVIAVVELVSGAVATSGGYERGAHVFDPRTRSPATGLASVTVVDDDLGRADAYSTAACALGADALDWLRTVPGCRAYVVAADGIATALGFEPAAV